MSQASKKRQDTPTAQPTQPARDPNGKLSSLKVRNFG